MGCASSSQTSAVDTSRPSAKPEESNGASTTGVANENGNIAEDSETIPDQTSAGGNDAKPDGEPAVAAAAAVAAASGDDNSANPAAGEESQPPAETPAPDTPETATSSSEAAAPEPETKAEEAPAPSE